MQRGPRAGGELGDAPWVTRHGSGLLLVQGLALMSWAIGGPFEQTKEKYQKANWSQGENE